jgi:hypothetical protein
VSERRRYPRTTGRVSAVQHVGNQRLQRTVGRLGPGGFFVEAKDPAKAGELVVMEFADGDTLFRVTGEVAYVDAQGFGVRITRADWERLSRLLGQLS